MKKILVIVIVVFICSNLVAQKTIVFNKQNIEVDSLIATIPVIDLDGKENGRSEFYAHLDEIGILEVYEVSYGSKTDIDMMYKYIINLNQLNKDLCYVREAGAVGSGMYIITLTPKDGYNVMVKGMLWGTKEWTKDIAINAQIQIKDKAAADALLKRYLSFGE